MSSLIRLTFPLIGYFCVATVLTMGVGYGYLRHKGYLDDEKLFRIVSMLHGINLEELKEMQSEDENDVPPEEISFSDQQKQMQVALLHMQAKKDDLEKQKGEFDSIRRQANTMMGRYAEVQQEVETYLEQRKEEASESGLVDVRGQLENLDPRKQAKPLLMQMLAENRTDVVILLLSGMRPRYRNEILSTFDSEDDIALLHKMHDQMLAGHPERTFIEDQIKKLEKLKEQDNR